MLKKSTDTDFRISQQKISCELSSRSVWRFPRRPLLEKQAELLEKQESFSRSAWCFPRRPLLEKRMAFPEETSAREAVDSSREDVFPRSVWRSPRRPLLEKHPAYLEKTDRFSRSARALLKKTSSREARCTLLREGSSREEITLLE